MKKLISIIIPAYNEEDCVKKLSTRLQSLFSKESNYDFEAIIVENGSLLTRLGRNLNKLPILIRDLRF